MSSHRQRHSVGRWVVRRTVTVVAIGAAVGLAMPGIASGTHSGDHDERGPSPGPPAARVIPDVTITVEHEPSHLEIEMKNLTVSSIQIGGSADEDAKPTETVTLNFGEIPVEYTPHEPDDDDGKSITVERWDPAEESAT